MKTAPSNIPGRGCLCVCMCMRFNKSVYEKYSFRHFLVIRFKILLYRIKENELI